jgi:quercetin dioxygenase-like cupin family protein
VCHSRVAPKCTSLPVVFLRIAGRPMLMRKKEPVPPIVIAVDDLDEEVETYTRLLGWELEMITPADSPTVAVLRRKDLSVRLEKRLDKASGSLIPQPKTKNPHHPIVSRADDASKWAVGRAGMEYRDLIPGRLGGRVIASHIRIPNGGEVADYVHYHKVRFQMIYCVAGSIRVVYEDFGEPFWLKPGDCVLQPPEIRHRVLEAAANSEVVEISSPAEHETWADHEMELPTGRILPGRDFSGQLFVRHIAIGAEWNEGEFGRFESRDTGISAATNGLADVRVLRAEQGGVLPANFANEREVVFFFVLKGGVKLRLNADGEQELTAADGVVVPKGASYELKAAAGSEILCAAI